jgi:hypothetical protein
MTAKQLNHRQARWSLYLSRFNFVLHHCPGMSMGKCEALSQWADHGDGDNNNCDTMLLQPEFFAVCALKGIMVEGSEQDILKEVQKGI